jgi:thiamine-phosphate pyrophosphorylase
MNNKLLYKNYIFLEKINDLIKENLLKFSNINIIIDINHNEIKKSENALSIINFARKNKIPFLIKNNFQECIKYKADGILIESQNKRNIKPLLLKRKFNIIGKAHNQLEYLQKVNQSCSLIMLSPLFYNKKYSKNKILDVLKFNNFALNWKTPICALGGINFKTLKKVKLLRTTNLSHKKLIFEAKIKKPACKFNCRLV